MNRLLHLAISPFAVESLDLAIGISPEQQLAWAELKETTENQRQYIERAGYTIDCWYADESVFGKVAAMQRPQFTKLLGRIRDGETLVVTKLDRLGRDA